MATTIAEPPHLAADLKTLCLSTIGAQWRLLAEQAARQRQAPADYLAQLVHLEVESILPSGSLLIGQDEGRR